ncbi:hypothetical protein [Desulfosporosinus sp. I2]|uniref:hypothetical protein n=1 Tax=Desulfosporosinus sp. I2 TaxID=1617025 RepID=UPI0005EFA8BC|nr:hypothetical protein [Desulfosporosinus sp. I2]
MPPTKRWSDLFLYLGRVLILLILLAVLLPKLVMVCNNWMSTLLHNDQKPVGHPLRVDVPLRGDENYTRKDDSVKFIL